MRGTAWLRPIKTIGSCEDNATGTYGPISQASGARVLTHGGRYRASNQELTVSCLPFHLAPLL